MQSKYILSLESGTTSANASIFNKSAQVIANNSVNLTQIYPNIGWVEHDPDEMLRMQLMVAKSAITEMSIQASDIAAIGITNQRETTVIWNKNTGTPIYNAIGWQDRRTVQMVDELKQLGLSEIFQEKTGLVLDAYFSGTKIKWILDNVAGARELANSGELLFGTIDTWLIWNLSDRKNHITDESNASRTLLFNIHTGNWDEELLKVLDIPRSMLPAIVTSSGIMAETTPELFGVSIPITGIAGDQQAATFGNLCIKPGMVKNTYGTGCFLMMNTGDKPFESNNNLITTIGWNIDNKREYCLEGSVFMGGAVTDWLHDGLGFSSILSEIETLATSIPNNGGIVMVPSFGGVGAPHWDPHAQGVIIGIDANTKQAHIARAALESIAFQVYDVVSSMEHDSNQKITTLRVDGLVCKNDFLMQFQADILNCIVERPVNVDLVGLGIAYLAGLGVGFWQSVDELSAVWQIERRFIPQMDTETRLKLLNSWHQACSVSFK